MINMYQQHYDATIDVEEEEGEMEEVSFFDDVEEEEGEMEEVSFFDSFDSQCVSGKCIVKGLLRPPRCSAETNNMNPEVAAPCNRYNLNNLKNRTPLPRRRCSRRKRRRSRRGPTNTRSQPSLCSRSRFPCAACCFG